MSRLKVITLDGQLVVDSREVAVMVGKNHSHLLRDIKGYAEILTKSNFGLSEFFIESTYQDSTGRTLPCYLITKKGCDMVANKMTGEKGVLFTAEYVTKFEEMEKQLAIPAPTLTNEKQLREQLKLSIMTSERVDQVSSKVDKAEERINMLENTMRIDGVQEFKLRSQGQAKVLEILGGIESAAYKQVGRKAFAELWRDFKRHFQIPRYGELARSQFEEGVYFITKWHPSTTLQIKIEECNRQLPLKLVRAE